MTTQHPRLGRLQICRRGPYLDQGPLGPALHDNGIGLQEVALVEQHTLRDLYQRGARGRPSVANWPGTKVRISATTPSAMRSTSIASGLKSSSPSRRW